MVIFLHVCWTMSNVRTCSPCRPINLLPTISVAILHCTQVNAKASNAADSVSSSVKDATRGAKSGADDVAGSLKSGKTLAQLPIWLTWQLVYALIP